MSKNRYLAAWDSLDLATSFNQDLINDIFQDTSYKRAILNPGSAYFEDIIAPYYGDSRVIVVLTETGYANFMSDDCASLLWTQEQGSFPPGPWCPYVPNWDGIEPLKAKMDDGTILTEQTAALLYNSNGCSDNVEETINTGVAANVGWFYITDSNSPWSTTPIDCLMDAQAARIVASCQ